MTTHTLLDEAKGLIYGDRADAYGSYQEHAEKLAIVFGVILDTNVPVEKVPLLLAALKMVRLAQDPTHTDSWVDLAGYAGCAGKLPTVWA